MKFTGGDGSYEHAKKDGITVAVVPDFPFTYQDEKTKEPAGIDIEIIKEAGRRLGISKLSWQVMPMDSVIPGLLSKRVDLVADNLHENPKRLAVVAFTSPVYFYGGAVATQILKSGTSAGANYEEADDGSSPRDRRAKRQIVLRELKETSFRLRVLRQAGILSAAHDPVIGECAELAKIVATLLHKSRRTSVGSW